MPKSNEFVDYLLERLEPFGQVTARAMFGGYGIYHNQLMFGLVADDMLYLKVDNINRKEFEERKLQPFVYVKQGKAMKMSYYQVPEEALDNSDETCRWAELAYSAALRGQSKTKKKK
ncbi:TfoX/Sxy family protein [candidate division KSB1 bacterium]|nr:TfoX/Sxy family protein [candidate division KSB1 bacterium]